jgi:hypothetical protein
LRIISTIAADFAITKSADFSNGKSGAFRPRLSRCFLPSAGRPLEADDRLPSNLSRQFDA